jgi:phosphatidylserine/phosphatidylglycerophosphate/cardiolipin synthase-like enzyme
MRSPVHADGLTIAVTGTAWMGGGVGSVQSAMEELLNKAEIEIQIAVYEMTAGATEFLNRLRACLATGVRVTMIINRYDDKPLSIRQRLEDMARRFPYFEILNFQPESSSEDLHAKILVVDRCKALVGSANLTWKGLVGNHELAVVVSGSVASKIAELVDRLCADPRATKVM